MPTDLQSTQEQLIQRQLDVHNRAIEAMKMAMEMDALDTAMPEPERTLYEAAIRIYQQGGSDPVDAAVTAVDIWEAVQDSMSPKTDEKG